MCGVSKRMCDMFWLCIGTANGFWSGCIIFKILGGSPTICPRMDPERNGKNYNFTANGGLGVFSQFVVRTYKIIMT